MKLNGEMPFFIMESWIEGSYGRRTKDTPEHLGTSFIVNRRKELLKLMTGRDLKLHPTIYSRRLESNPIAVCHHILE